MAVIGVVEPQPASHHDRIGTLAGGAAGAGLAKRRLGIGLHDPGAVGVRAVDDQLDLGPA